MLVVIVSLLALDVIGGVQFQLTDPIQLVETEYKAERGITELHLSIKFDDPCIIDEQEWKSVYDIKKIAYERIQQLCGTDYTAVLELLEESAECLPETSGRKRVPRVVPLLVGGATMGIVAGAKVTYRYLAYNSDYNRLNRLEDRERDVNKTLEDLVREQRNDHESQRQLIGLAEGTSKTAQDNKNGIIQLATLTSDVSWTSSKVGVRLENYRDGLRMMKARCKSRQFSMDGLRKIKDVKELSNIRDEDTWISGITMTSKDTITFEINIMNAAPAPVPRASAPEQLKECETETPELIAQFHEFQTFRRLQQGLLPPPLPHRPRLMALPTIESSSPRRKRLGHECIPPSYKGDCCMPSV